MEVPVTKGCSVTITSDWVQCQLCAWSWVRFPVGPIPHVISRKLFEGVGCHLGSSFLLLYITKCPILSIWANVRVDPQHSIHLLYLKEYFIISVGMWHFIIRITSESSIHVSDSNTDISLQDSFLPFLLCTQVTCTGAMLTSHITSTNHQQWVRYFSFREQWRSDKYLPDGSAGFSVLDKPRRYLAIWSHRNSYRLMDNDFISESGRKIYPRINSIDHCIHLLLNCWFHSCQYHVSGHSLIWVHVWIRLGLTNLIWPVFPLEEGRGGGYNTPLEWPKIGNICYLDQEI
jgi:hypothetical protein